MRLTQGVIIDVDGTLVNSNGARAQAWTEALKAHDHPASYDEIHRLMGLVPEQILLRTLGLGLDTPTGRAVYDRAQAIFRRRLLPRLTTFFQAADLVRWLRARGLRVAVASSDTPEVLGAILRTIGSEHLLSRAAAFEQPPDANRDVVKVALDRLGASPPNVVMIADAPHDVDAAATLHVPTIGLTCGGWTASDLSGAAAVYHDPADLLRHAARSPLGRLVSGASAA
jgi:phosphoglycolate phosphatase-like HAD superfamily hydrolase